MFTPSQRSDTKTNTTIMKTIKVTYTEVQYITYTKEIEVTNAQLKELQKEGQFHGQLLEAMEHQAAQHGEQIVNSRQMELNF
jgi:recombinational DNA repair ATPase RecF